MHTILSAPPISWLNFGLGWLVLAGLATEALAAGIRVEPPQLALAGNFDRAQLVVSQSIEGLAADRALDLTSQSEFTSSNPAVVEVSPKGRVLITGNGTAEIRVKVGNEVAIVPVTAEGFVSSPEIRFAEEITPILSKAGCNAGACHASQYGKGGFKLSVFGFAPDEDYEAIVRDRHSRRVNLLEPEKSLVLLKPSMAVPHGGSRRLEVDSVDHQILVRWLGSGAMPPAKKPSKVKSLSIYPPDRVGEAGFQQQYRVTATYDDGRTRDVTHWAKYDSLDPGLVEVDSNGLAKAIGRGQAGVMVRFEGQAEVATMVVAYGSHVELTDWVDQNYIDTIAAAKFRELGIEPSPRCDDATFIRRVFLDVLGTLPSQAKAAAFIDSTDPDKRTKLIDQVLGLTGDPKQDIYNNEYAAFWSLKWGDLLRSSSQVLGEQGMWALHNWIQGSFRENKPFDRFVRELITAKGSIYMSGPANYYRVANNPLDQAESTAQLFLGVRLQCAKCHHHPFEKYSLEDYYGFAAFFARVGTKGSQEFGLFGREQVVLVKSDGEIRHPKTNQVLPPTTLDGDPAAEAIDRRQPLAEWLTSRENDFFAKNVVNRYMAYLFGRGLVEPVDDLRNTNPASNAELLDRLAAELKANQFNLKLLLRDLLNSRLYQLSSQPTASNLSDDRFYSYYKVKRIAAEPLLDALDRITEVQTKYEQLPLGTRAIDLPDARYNNLFLVTFGKPVRASVCECERGSDANLAQALHTLNGEIVSLKISDPKGRVARLIAAKKPAAEIITELYLSTLSRRPTEAEMTACEAFVASCPNAKVGYEDLLWALVNSKQFLFVH